MEGLVYTLVAAKDPKPSGAVFGGVGADLDNPQIFRGSIVPAKLQAARSPVLA
jgi:hypothetical protein